MYVEYFPCDTRFKKPIGGVAVNEDFELTVYAEKTARSAFAVLTKDGEQPVYYEMAKTDCGDRSEFTLKMRVTTSGLYFYYFVIDSVPVYADIDLCASAQASESWQLTAYRRVYDVPDMTDGGIIYQIMPDRFHDGGKKLRTKTRDMVYRDDWGGVPSYKPDGEGIVQNRDMFGGNLYGVIEKLDYLKSLGVKVIYLNPIFEAASNHKYDTGNYRRVDGDFGGNEALVALIKAADGKGMKIMLDGVFSHTGADSIYFNKYGRYDSVGAYMSQSSPYYGWYDFEQFPDEYKCWWGVKILPCVNETNPTFDEFINGEEGIIRTYMRMGVAGWRLDVADELPDEFLTRLVRAAKKVNPKAMILGEVWEDASNKISYGERRRYMSGLQLDSATDYPLKDAIINFVACGDASGLKRAVNVRLNNYPKHILHRMMNLLGTHDTPRILTLLSGESLPHEKSERAEFEIKNRAEAAKRLKTAAVLQYTLPGVPCVYYGDEAGMEGCEDPFNRRCFPWGNEDVDLTEFYCALGNLRKLPQLTEGDITDVAADGKCFAFTRGGNVRIVANAGEISVKLSAPAVDLITGKTVGKVRPMQAIAYII